MRKSFQERCQTRRFDNSMTIRARDEVLKYENDDDETTYLLFKPPNFFE